MRIPPTSDWTTSLRRMVENHYYCFQTDEFDCFVCSIAAFCPRIENLRKVCRDCLFSPSHEPLTLYVELQLVVLVNIIGQNKHWPLGFTATSSRNHFGSYLVCPGSYGDRREPGGLIARGCSFLMARTATCLCLVSQTACCDAPQSPRVLLL